MMMVPMVSLLVHFFWYISLHLWEIQVYTCLVDVFDYIFCPCY